MQTWERPTTVSPPRTTAALAMVLGSTALVVGLTEPAGTASRGFLVTTIGISAIIAGVRAVRRARWGSTAVRAFGRTGAVFGGVGSALMAYALTASLLAPTGVQLPALSLRNAIHGTSTSAPMAASTPAARAPLTTPAPRPAAAAQPAGFPTTAPVPSSGVPASTDDPAWVPTNAQVESAAVTSSMQALAAAMEKAFPTGGFPSTLQLGRGTSEAVLLPDGTPLAAVPNGARVTYGRSDDGTSWTASIQGASFGERASFDSTTGVVTTG